MKKNIYLDYASATPTAKQVLKAMEKYWRKYYGNPSSLHTLGTQSKQAIEEARLKIAKILNCQTEEIIFTGGGTASVNLAIKGVIQQLNKAHLIISAIEHPAVFHSALSLKKQGHQVSVLAVDKDGLIRLDELKKTIKNHTRLISIMLANNEIGVIQDIQKIGAFIEKTNKIRQAKNLPKIYFHTDACQAAAFLDLNVKKLHLDLLSINASKIYGPKGTGLLYVKSGTVIKALVDGGGQENNLRSGTENVPGIVGLAKALELVQISKKTENKRLSNLRDALIKALLKNIPGSRLNGHPHKRLANNVNISIPHTEGETVILYLDKIGIQASTGSACSSGDLEPSHVIMALDHNPQMAKSSLRFSLGKNTKKQDIKYLINKLPKIIKQIRKNNH